MNRVGTFQVTSGRIEVSDPCYEGGDGHSFPARNGTWIAEIEMKDEGSWGMRVARLFARHESVGTRPVNPSGYANVDSGQMSVSDGGQFHLLPGELYDDVCRRTRPAAIIEDFAVVSNSGIGDGGYEVLISVDCQGKLNAVEIVFLPDDEPGYYDEEDDDE